MSEKTTLKESSLEELQMKQKKYRNFVIILSICTLFALAGLIYFAVKSDNYSLLTLCGGFSFALLLCSIVLIQIEKEIKSRI